MNANRRTTAIQLILHFYCSALPVSPFSDLNGDSKVNISDPGKTLSKSLTVFHTV